MTVSAAKKDRAELATHLIKTPHPEWAGWRCAGLRGAGFPADGVLKLSATPEVLRAVERYLNELLLVEQTRESSLREVNACLDELRARGKWNDKAHRNRFVRARDYLKSANDPQKILEMEECPSMRELKDALKRSREAADAYKTAFQLGAENQSEAIWEVASSPKFREAVLWQNRAAVHNALAPLLRAHDRKRARDSQLRQYEELVASHLQRYSVKNDTIGFFGPVGWGKLAEEGATLTAVPGNGLVTARKVYFESWPIEALANEISKDRNVYPWLAPIRMPFLHIEGCVMSHPVYGAVNVSPDEALILSACNGRLLAKNIVEDYTCLPGNYGKDAEAYEIMAQLAAKRLLYWGFVIPLGPHPETSLRKGIERIGEEPVRIRALSVLEQFEKGRQALEQAAGDSEKVDVAFEGLEKMFTRLTGLSSTRHNGKTYGGRTLAYEDCRRDVDLCLGPDLLRNIAEPLSLLLTSARWLTFHIAATYKAKLIEIYSRLTRQTGSPVIDASALWVEAMPYLIGENADLTTRIQKEFQEKWARILGPFNGGRMQYQSESLRSMVESEFAAPRAGWIKARYHSPDIMIAASSQDAIRQNDYQLVLGELHVADNTLSASLFFNQHPCPQQLLDAVEQDLGAATIIPMMPKSYLNLGRTTNSLITNRDFLLEYTLDTFAEDRSKAIPISALVVERSGDELTVHSRDRKFCCDAIELLGGFPEMVREPFKTLLPQAHSPRISIDRLVIMRESWRFHPNEIAFVQEKQQPDRFLLAQKWARAHGLPTKVFFKVPVETKPAYLDFDSPILVDIFSRMVRKTLDAEVANRTVEISEMLPTLEQTWLTDAQQCSYTCELRMVMLDLVH
jgi:hypothetical protein